MTSQENSTNLRQLELQQQTLKLELCDLINSNGDTERIYELRGQIYANRKGENGLAGINRILKEERRRKKEEVKRDDENRRAAYKLACFFLK